jgi:hypothetical protein
VSAARDGDRYVHATETRVVFPATIACGASSRQWAPSVLIDKPLATATMKALAGEVAALWLTAFVLAARVENLH